MTSALTLGEGAAGVVMAGFPATAARWAGGPGGQPPAWVVRVLGGRMAAQALVVRWVAGRSGPRDRRRAVRAGAAVDGLHGASMIAAAAVFPRYRRSALASAAVAFVAAGLAGAATR